MEPQEIRLRAIATSFGWTWYRMRRLIDAHLSAHGASMARLKLLVFLAEQPCRSTDIASFFDQAPRTVTQAIDWLEQNGLVLRSPVAEDRRVKLVQITDAGRGMLEQALPLYDGIVAQTFGSLTAEELEALDSATLHLGQVVDKLEKEAGFRQGRVPTLKAKNND
ncbi:MarR family transcriptional regulator [Sphingomonas sp. AR_OL41]|uniref:MarR family winged helix-turn-helix transcriptional regulator n=1 Tax=Sphingomonas sp. AR_OL41 TaxID=3042729 RepID=UPI0024808650|nr:MarR family transcriptional regulator [Sphingomonas sp. AR_OL41]MDH7972972.1 MarR family transcriptional regulator [Sphingomonas sp. AR_OL41]